MNIRNIRENSKQIHMSKTVFLCLQERNRKHMYDQQKRRYYNHRINSLLCIKILLKFKFNISLYSIFLFFFWNNSLTVDMQTCNSIDLFTCKPVNRSFKNWKTLRFQSIFYTLWTKRCAPNRPKRLTLCYLTFFSTSSTLIMI